MVTYIKLSIRGYYVDFPEAIDAEYWAGQIGTTYQDFLDDKWIELSNVQVQFHEEHPNASIEEVLNMKLNEIPQPTEAELIERAKDSKISELYRYDSSDEVNIFTINGVLKAWFNQQERSNYKNSIESAKLLGVDNLQLFVGTNLIELSTDKAAQLLAMIQLYADACYMVTKQHEAKIKELNNKEEIEAYDYTAGYPEKLNFDL